MTATTSKLGADTMDQKTQMREGFEAQRKAGMNVDWFTWQIAWHDALFTVHDIAGDSLARQPAAIDRQEAVASDSSRLMRAPFANCQFRECDLPGQCRSEGKCHHPRDAAPLDKGASKPAAPSVAQDERGAFGPAMKSAPTPEQEKQLDEVLNRIFAEPDRCYAPSCGKWDGNDSCACKRAASTSANVAQGAEAQTVEEAYMVWEKAPDYCPYNKRGFGAGYRAALASLQPAQTSGDKHAG